MAAWHHFATTQRANLGRTRYDVAMDREPDNQDAMDAAIRLLDWYRANGVDAALCDQPIDWLKRGDTPLGAGFTRPLRQHSAASSETAARVAPGPTSAPPRPSPSQSRNASPQSPPPPARPQTPLAPSSATSEAQDIARRAKTLSELGSALADFNGCALKATATKLCFYRGAENARLMIIGEAPGRDEDLSGQPFVGRAGQLLDRMLAAIDLTERDVHITNIVYWRPPGNRTPTAAEALACRPFLDRQISLVAPDVIVVLGGAAAKELLSVSDGIMRLRGKWRDVAFANQTIPVLATLHPAYLLRTPAAKKLAWLDLLNIKARLQAPA